MDYQIAVPSYNRASTLKNKTLTFLEQHNISRNKITIWVANQDELYRYRDEIGDSWNIQISQKGLVASRCYYHSQYAHGTRILNIDDDIENLLIGENNRLRPYSQNLDQFICNAFTNSEKYKVRLWGVNGAANPMFLKEQIIIGLRYLVGAFFGSYANDEIFDINNRTDKSSGEDFEMTLMAYERDGAVLRHDGITIKTAYFATGGIDQELKDAGITDRQIEHDKTLRAIANKYQDIAKVYTKAKGVTNIRLKPITIARIKQ